MSLSCFDQDLTMLELKYKQHAEDFNSINTFQKEDVFIAIKRYTEDLSSVQVILLKSSRGQRCNEVNPNAVYPSRQGKGNRLKVMVKTLFGYLYF